MKKMKVLAFMLLGFGLMFTACSQDETAGGVKGTGNGTLRISLNAADAIQVRAISGSNSAKGGNTNVDNSEYQLRYVAALYDGDGNVVKDENGNEQQIVTVSVGSSASGFEWDDLDDSETYTVVAWADFVTTEDEDLHYDTSDLTTITYKDGIAINDESFDAFYASQEVNTSETAETITLNRPFAKLRLVAYNATEDNTPDAISIAYTGLTRYTTFNALTGEASEEASELNYSANAIPEYEEDADNEGHMTILVDYILVGSEAQEDVTIEYTATQDGNEVGSHTVGEVPFQTNYLTTVYGTLLNSASEEEIGTQQDDMDTNDDFDDEYEVPVETTVEPYNDITVASYTESWLATDGSSAEVKEDDNGESYLLVTTTDAGRADLKLSASEAVVLDPAEAPILCFRITNLNDEEDYTCNITIDTSGNLVSDNTKYSGGLGGNNNQWSENWYCDDGTELLIYDLAEKKLTMTDSDGNTSSELLPSACSFGTFQIKYAEIQQNGSAVKAEYSFYWFKSFASIDDLEEYLTENNISYSTSK